MKTNAIFTRELTTTTVSAFDLVRQGWQIQSIDINGVITATKQEVVACDPKTAASNMTTHNLFNSEKKYGTEIITKIDFGVGKTGLFWDAAMGETDTFMNRPIIH